jgi:hypothetical protein
MNQIFKNIDIEEFENLFSTEEKCLMFLDNEKWKNGFTCRKCGHTNYCEGKMPYSRRCTRCKYQESATAHTIFHRCKIPIQEAFKITYLVCSMPQISSHELSRRNDIRQMTCWNLKKKITGCLAKNGELSIIDNK